MPLLSPCLITTKHLSAVRSMADKCLLDYAALQAGTLYIKGIVFYRWPCASAIDQIDGLLPSRID